MNGVVRIAIPKGRLFEPSLDLLARAGVYAPGDERETRKLIFGNGDGFEFIALKPIDIPVYVESGSIDAGIVGSDILRELDSDVYEPVDLKIGRCAIALAAPEGRSLDYSQSLRIATKYPRTAERFFRTKNAHVHVVRLDGSVEIAPILGLADAIVDVVETGRTLRDNGMAIVEEIARVTSKLIVNRTALKVKAQSVGQLVARLDAVVYENS